jgi:hypothetical protein
MDCKRKDFRDDSRAVYQQTNMNKTNPQNPPKTIDPIELGKSFPDYQRTILRTESNQAGVRYAHLRMPVFDRYIVLGENEFRLVHAALLLSTESMELALHKQGDRAHIIEELADLQWALALASDALGETLIDVHSDKDLAAYPCSIRAIYQEVEKVSSTVKALVCYNRKEDKKTGDHYKTTIMNSLRELNMLIAAWGYNMDPKVPIEKIRAANFCKLSIRYPGLAFSCESANNRDTVKEIAAIQA